MPFMEWIIDPEKGFIVRDAWDVEKGEMGGTGKMVLLPPWDKILEHVLAQDEQGRFPYTTVVLSDIKKSAKTAISGAVTAWYAECAPDGTEVFVCANSEDQSVRLIYKDLTFHFKQREMGAKPFKEKIILPNDTTIQVLTKNYTSNAGGRHALVVFDELWGGRSVDDYRRWEEMTPIPTIPHSLRLVTSYAGFYGESNVLYDVYLEAVGKEECPDGKGEPVKELEDLPCYHNGNAYFAYWNHEPRMPWQTEDYYESQRRVLRASAYIRLHENRWVSSNEIFIPMEWWDYATTKLEQSADLWRDHPYRNNPVYIGVDTAMKHDCTAVVGVAPVPDEGKIAILFHKIWSPVEGELLDLETTLEPYLLNACHKYNVVDITCDPSQMLQLMGKLQTRGLPISEFVQSEGTMIPASQNLYDLLHDQNLWVYPSEELQEHLRNTVAQNTSRGYRIVKDKSNRRMALKKIDAAVAMAMACYKAVLGMDYDMGEVIHIESPFGEYASNRNDPQEAHLPFALRTGL